MSEVKTGLWQCNLDGSYIKVRRVGPDAISYSKEGCMDVHDMPKSELLSCYQLYEADDPIARPYDIEWDMGTWDKSELAVVCQNCNNSYQCYHNRKSVERSGVCYICANGCADSVDKHKPAKNKKRVMSNGFYFAVGATAALVAAINIVLIARLHREKNGLIRAVNQKDNPIYFYRSAIDYVLFDKKSQDLVWVHVKGQRLFLQIDKNPWVSNFIRDK